MRGVVITGTGRSGTSLVAGLFAAHGVFFGNCKPADRHNPKGYFEHRATPLPKAKGTGWPGVWWKTLRREGWDGKVPWGIKNMTSRWRWFRRLHPTLVVITKRPESEVRASLKKTGWGINADKLFRKYRKRRGKILKQARCPVLEISTPLLIAGDFREIRRAFDVLGVPFNPDVARSWIDPGVWHGEERGP
jgi:hypothetical protein